MLVIISVSFEHDESTQSVTAYPKSPLLHRHVALYELSLNNGQPRLVLSS